jgi:hypothetical protein
MNQTDQAQINSSGSCMCGVVRFSFQRANSQVGICHCGMCRRWSGGMFLAAEISGEIKVENTENLGLYASSEWGERGFCKVCGSSLFWRMRDGGHAVVSAQCIDDLEDAELVSEIFYDDKPDYYNIAEATHKMTGAEVFAVIAPKAD